MVNFKKLADKAKDAVDKRGGTDSLKEDFGELKDIAKSKGSVKDKAMAAKDAIKDPGAPGADEGRPEGQAGGDGNEGGGHARPPAPQPAGEPQRPPAPKHPNDPQ